LNKKSDLYLLKKDLAKLYQSKCYVCKKNFGKGFTFHHKWYNEGEKIYSDFEKPLDYYTYLAPIIRKTPEQFLLLCKGHHSAVEHLKKFKPDKLKRLLKAVKMSQS